MKPAPLSDVQERALDALRADGVAVVPFAELFGDDAFWAELESDMRTFVEAAEQELAGLSPAERKERYGNKSFLVRRFRAKIRALLKRKKRKLFFTVRESAKILRLSEQQIYSLIYRKLMGCHRMTTGKSGGIRISRRQLVGYIRSTVS